MELTIRDWMVIVGVLLIVAVLLDAWRRVRNDRRSRVRVKLAEPPPAPPGAEREAELEWLKELPNGGARVVERGDIRGAAGASGSGGEAGSLAADGADPDPVALVEGLSSAESGEGDNFDWLDGIGTGEVAAGTASGRGRLPRDQQTEVFMLNVVARDPAGFRGEDIMHILLACDLRFGDMDFFHRHEYEAGRGAIQFSVANMMQPGVFDIDRMSEVSTPGLVFFVTLPGPDDMMKAYDYMLETAQAVARNLGGDVLDESRSVLTRQATEHARQQIRELEQRMLAKAR